MGFGLIPWTLGFGYSEEWIGSQQVQHLPCVGVNLGWLRLCDGLWEVWLMVGFGAPPGVVSIVGGVLGVMVRYQDSPALIVVLVVGYLGFIYCLLLLAQQQGRRSLLMLPRLRLVSPKWLIRLWRWLQNPSAQFMEDEL